MEHFSDYKQFIDTLFYAIVTGGIGLLGHFLNKLATSVSSLNEKLATIVEKTRDHDYRIQRLEKKQDNE